MDADGDDAAFERPMRVEFYEEYLGDLRVICARFILHEDRTGPSAASVWHDEEVAVSLVAFYLDAPPPTEGFDEPQQIALVNVDEFVAAYEAFRRRSS